MLELTNEEIVLLNTIAESTSYTVLKRNVLNNETLCSDIYNRISSDALKLPYDLETNTVDTELNRLWDFINNLSESQGETLEFCNDLYLLSRVLKVNGLLNV